MHAHHSKCPAYADLVSFPLAVFRNTMSKAVSKAVKPPAKKHLGKKLRVVSPFVTAKELVLCCHLTPPDDPTLAID